MHLQTYTIIFILKWLVIQMIYPSSNNFLNEQKILWEINKAKDFFEMFYFSHDLSVTKSGTFPILKVPQKSILLKHYKFKNSHNIIKLCLCKSAT